MDYIENLFHNVTRAQIAGLRLLRYQQSDLRKWHTEELAHIKVVRDAQNDLLEESANIKVRYGSDYNSDAVLTSLRSSLSML
ncbi:hypothetical protein HDU85_001875 [Gaertneriomyces sp. JEL0708]|nr:hypothetical protein HDU85_001875 [Gaertneriomyces sp. JEL0708]